MNKPIIILGGGGHASVLVDALRLQNFKILGVTSINIRASSKLELPFLGTDEKIFENYKPSEIQLVNGVGSTQVDPKRKDLFLKFKEKKYTFSTVIHPSAIIARNVVLGEGVQIMAGVIIQSNSQIGENTIINTRSSIDHDCVIGAHCHIAPGSTLCGDITLGKESFVGAGSVIIQGVSLNSKTFIRAKSLITNSTLTQVQHD